VILIVSDVPPAPMSFQALLDLFFVVVAGFPEGEAEIAGVEVHGLIACLNAGGVAVEEHGTP